VIETHCPQSAAQPGVAADELLAVARTSQLNARSVGGFDRVYRVVFGWLRRVKRTKTRVLFVCAGNTYRSVMAEFIARGRFGSVIEPASAGFRPQQAADAKNASYTLQSLLKIDASGHEPQDIRQLDVSSFDLVVAMDEWVADNFMRDFPTYPPEHLIRWKIDDPYGDDLEQYRTYAQAVFKELKGLVKGTG